MNPAWISQSQELQELMHLFNKACSLSDFNRRHLALRPDIENCTVYSKELEQLQKLLHFPEEVAFRLTETEHKLFQSVPPVYYIRQLTVDLSRPHCERQCTHPSVHELIQRFSEVSV